LPFYNEGTPKNQTHEIGCEMDTFRFVQGPRGIAYFPQNGRGGQGMALRHLMSQLYDSKEPLTFSFRDDMKYFS